MAQGYVLGDLSQALRTARSHEDPATRARADERATAWTDVLEGMASGQLRIGLRSPVRGLPVWVTPRVLRGGFATGRLAAGGPCRPMSRTEPTGSASHTRVPCSSRSSSPIPAWPSSTGCCQSAPTGSSWAEESALLTVAWTNPRNGVKIRHDLR